MDFFKIVTQLYADYKNSQHNYVGRLKLKGWFNVISIKILVIFVNKYNIIQNSSDQKLTTESYTKCRKILQKTVTILFP